MNEGWNDIRFLIFPKIWNLVWIDLWKVYAMAYLILFSFNNLCRILRDYLDKYAFNNKNNINKVW